MDLKGLSYNKLEKAALFAEVVAACSELLYHKDAINYKKYIESRLSKNSIKNFNIGYFPNNYNIDIITKIINLDILYKLELIYYYDDFENKTKITKSYLHNNNLIFPFKDEYGNIISMSGRTLLSDKEMKALGVSKYKNTFFQKSLNLFGLYNAKQSILANDKAIVVEGQIDCITCHENGIYNVVSSMGSDLSLYQFFLLKKYTNNIVLLLDNDKAGIKGKEKAISKFSKHSNIYEKNIIPVIYKDIAQYLKENGDTVIFNNI